MLSELYVSIFRLSCQIRSALFSLVVAVCVSLPSFVSGHPQLLCPLVLGALGEADPLPMGPLWEAAILLLSVLEVKIANEPWVSMSVNSLCHFLHVVGSLCSLPHAYQLVKYIPLPLPFTVCVLLMVMTLCYELLYF